MFESFFAPSIYPFTLALGVFAGLLVLELVLSFLGATLFGGSDGPDLELDAPDIGEVDIDLPDLGDLDLSDFEIDAEPIAAPQVAPVGFVHALGFGRVPFMIWFAALLVGFGLTGQSLQLTLAAWLGGPAPLWLAVPVALGLGLAFAKVISATLARLLPKTETEALSETSFGRRRGIVTQGTARRGSPAEVRVTDRFGNAHYLRAEPLGDDVEIASGSTVLVLRHRAGAGYRLVNLTE